MCVDIRMRKIGGKITKLFFNTITKIKKNTQKGAILLLLVSSGHPTIEFLPHEVFGFEVEKGKMVHPAGQHHEGCRHEI